MKIFITGGTGLVGKDIVSVLAKEHKLFVLIRDDEKQNIFKNLANIVFVGGCLEDPDDFEDILNKCDIVLHIAGTAEPKKSMKTNYELTKKLIDTCKKNQKFVFISSFNVIFKNPGMYAISKKMAEKIIQESGLDYLIFRPTLFYNRYGELYIAKLIRQIIKFPFSIQPGNGNYFIQPLLTNDFAKIVSTGLRKIDNRIIPVAGEEPISIKELIELILFYTKKRPIIPVPLWLLKIFGPLVGINRDKIKELSEDKTMNVKNIEKEFNISLHSIKKTLPDIIAYVKTN